jgi:hypothetical protein
MSDKQAIYRERGVYATMSSDIGLAAGYGPISAYIGTADLVQALQSGQQTFSLADGHPAVHEIILLTALFHNIAPSKLATAVAESEF